MFDNLPEEEKLKAYADVIVGSAIGSSDEARENRRYLFGNAKVPIFKDEPYIIYSILYKFKDRDINIDSDFITLYLENNQKIIEEAASKQKIDVNSYGEVNDSAVSAYIGGVQKYFNSLVEDGVVPKSELSLALEKYLTIYKARETSTIYSKAIEILSDGVKFGRKLLQGFTDSRDYVKANLARLEGLVDSNNGAGFLFMSDVVLNPEMGMETTKVANFGDIAELNEHYGGVFTRNLYTISAPSKSGKSKFCTMICHRAIVDFGTNVSVWAVEGGYEAWTAQMRSIHFDRTYNENADVYNIKTGMTQGAIIKGEYEGTEMGELERTSAIDLVTNPKYGKVHYIDRPFTVETFIEEIDASVKANNSKIVFIDYMQLIGSERNMKKHERLSEAYPKLLDYCIKNNVAIISPSQYKQNVIDELDKRSEGDAKDMRTATGESYEIFKSSSVIVSLWASTEDLQNNEMTILPIPSRFDSAIPEFKIYVDLGYCQFRSINEG